MIVDASCNRVPVVDGHMECVSIKFERKPNIKELKEDLKLYRSSLHSLSLPSSPASDIHLFQHELDRPQPRLDLMKGNGFSVSVGRVRHGNYWDVQFTILSHNT